MQWQAAIVNSDFLCVVDDIQAAETRKSKTSIHVLTTRGYFGSVEPQNKRVER